MNNLNNEMETNNSYVTSVSNDTVSFCKKQVRLIILIIVSSVAVIFIAGLSVLLGIQVNKTKSAQKQANSFKATLLETEDSKNNLEAANTQLSDKNKQLDQKAADASQQAADAEEKAADAAKQLEDKLAEVKKVNDELSSKKSELEKAQRGISKFSKLESLFNSYDQSSGEFILLLDKAYKALLNGDQATYNDAISQLQPLANQISSESDDIQALFKKIKNNNY